jgi:hypothetical protein
MKRITGLLFYFILCLSCTNKTQHNTNTQQFPEGIKTYALIVGVLEWTDQYLPSFEKRNRKDKELYEVLKTTGVDESDIFFLMDKEATLKNIREKMQTVLSKTEKGSHFIFYYAGHGIHEKGKYYFANSDIETADLPNTGLDLDIISDLIVQYFKGDRVTLWADCCYSGGLAKTAETISNKGFRTCALTSATATNTSTGNWTYSQTLIDCLKGDAMMDNNNDGKISLNEMALQVKDAMKYRERQLNTFSPFNLDGDNTIVSNTRTETDKSDATIGSYVFALHGGKWEVARIISKTNEEYNCEFYFYSDKESKTLPSSKIKQPYFISYTIGSKVKVEYEGKWYDASIVKSEGDFYYITYTNYDNSYDEWVLYDRIRTGGENTKDVLWNGQYYKADILEVKDGKSYVHYTDYDYTWDEWTDSKNIK